VSNGRRYRGIERCAERAEGVDRKVSRVTIGVYGSEQRFSEMGAGVCECDDPRKNACRKEGGDEKLTLAEMREPRNVGCRIDEVEIEEKRQRRSLYLGDQLRLAGIA
jgi:hypothetical protein